MLYTTISIIVLMLILYLGYVLKFHKKLSDWLEPFHGKFCNLFKGINDDSFGEKVERREGITQNFDNTPTQQAEDENPLFIGKLTTNGLLVDEKAFNFSIGTIGREENCTLRIEQAKSRIAPYHLSIDWDKHNRYIEIYNEATVLY